MKSKTKKQIGYLVTFIFLFAVEVIIALFVHDNFVRPYIGDVIVTILVYCFVRVFFPQKIRLMPLYVFAFACAIEVGQYFNFVELIGLGSSRFFCTLLGTSFSWYDILCYAVGCIVCTVWEIISYAQRKK